MLLKRIILTTVLALFFVSNLMASGIDFFHGTWEEAKVKAKEENKLIFVDAYTTWCGPCKIMSANTFPNEAVGEFYNANFISLKLDMEKEGDGLTFSKAYNVRSFPTLLYIDGEGKLMHKAVGNMDPETFISTGKIALDPAARLENVELQYNAGNREPAFIRSYLNVLLAAKMDVKEVADWYFATQPEEALLSVEDFMLITEVVKDFHQPIFKFVFKHQDHYRALVGTEKVNKYLYKIFLGYIFHELNKDESHFLKAIKVVRSTGYIDAEKIISIGKIYFAYGKKDYKSLLEVATKHIKLYEWDNASQLTNISNLASGPRFKDKGVIEAAIKWSQRAIALDNAYFQNLVYANLLYKVGKNKKALKAAKKTQELAIQEGIDEKEVLALIDKINAMK